MKNKSYYFLKKQPVVYHEIVADSDMFEKFYEIENGKNTNMVAIPDGRVDIQCMWKEDELSAYICGSVMSGITSQVNCFDKCFGARFKVGVLPKEIKENLDIITDNRILLNLIFENSQLLECLNKELFLEQKADLILQIFERRAEVVANTIIEYLIKEIERKKGHVVISEIIDHTGYSHRYANHVFKSNVGCSIKKFASIIRLQESLFYLLNQDDDAIYDELGYYDQAHFIKDFKNFSSCTPSRMKKNAEKLKFI